jgi:hypothetical protein
MIAKYRKKTGTPEYYKLRASNGRNFYFTSEETALKVFNIYKRDTTDDTEWILCYIIENSKGEIIGGRIIDEIKKKKSPNYRLTDEALAIKQEEENNLSEIERMMKLFASQDIAEERECSRTFRRK